jgi:hypothetical protein
MFCIMIIFVGSQLYAYVEDKRMMYIKELFFVNF